MNSANLYDRLERALIALEYALADARSAEQSSRSPESHGILRSQDALQSAGEEIHEVLTELRAAALQDAATRARLQWNLAQAALTSAE